MGIKRMSQKLRGQYPLPGTSVGRDTVTAAPRARAYRCLGLPHPVSRRAAPLQAAIISPTVSMLKRAITEAASRMERILEARRVEALEGLG